MLQVKSKRILQEQCLGLGPREAQKAESDRWQISRLKRHQLGHKSECGPSLPCGMSVRLLQKCINLAIYEPM
ncbi:hypothetical protein D5086_000897 [Populus alba]|uniref:Uncharacterized protein n=1 Tax=Populus alba TaxID=43335 RepID=A0ACC4CX73_POPAL